jgi:hypothetical protein
MHAHIFYPLILKLFKLICDLLFLVKRYIEHFAIALNVFLQHEFLKIISYCSIEYS